MKKLSLFVSRAFRRFLAGCNSLRAAKIAGEPGVMAEKRSEEMVNSKSASTLADEIVRLMEKERIYKSPELDLKHLSERLQTPSYLVTKAINEGIGVNFYDLINRYRVEEVKFLLINHDCKRFTLMSVAFDAGFSSKTTFNTVFKKLTGLTPSSYRRQHCMNGRREVDSQWSMVHGR